MNCPVCDNEMEHWNTIRLGFIDIGRICQSCDYCNIYISGSHHVRVGDIGWNWIDGELLPLGKIAVAIAKARVELGK